MTKRTHARYLDRPFIWLWFIDPLKVTSFPFFLISNDERKGKVALGHYREHWKFLMWEYCVGAFTSKINVWTKSLFKTTNDLFLRLIILYKKERNHIPRVYLISWELRHGFFYKMQYIFNLSISKLILKDHDHSLIRVSMS